MPPALDRVREEEFARLGDSAYLDAASMTPLPERSRAAAEMYNLRRAEVHTLAAEDFGGALADVRVACASLIGADPSEIALGTSTSFGINLAALGLRVPPGSIALTSDREFPANVYPWMNRDRFRLERIPVNDRGWPDEDRICERVRDPAVSILALSSVQFANGYRADLDRIGRLCREEGTFFVVDAIQSLGQLPLDVSRTPIDVLATGGHKWLCSPFGTGFAYVGREVQERLDPTMIGWMGMEACQNLESLLEYDWRPLPDARKYEVGMPAFQNLVAFHASLGLLREVGIATIGDYLDTLLEPLRAWLLDHPEVEVLSNFERGHRSAIVSIRPPNLPRTTQELRAASVVCSVREGALRFAPHFYNRPEEIGRVIDVLDAAF